VIMRFTGFTGDRWGAVGDEALHGGEQCVMMRFTVCTVGSGEQ
jgi:hypothetical protein